MSTWIATVYFLAISLLNKWARVRLFPELIDLPFCPGKVSLLVVVNAKDRFVAGTSDVVRGPSLPMEYSPSLPFFLQFADESTTGEDNLPLGVMPVLVTLSSCLVKLGTRPSNWNIVHPRIKHTITLTRVSVIQLPMRKR